MAAAAPSSLRNLRACLQCKLVKNLADFRQNGCENCPDLGLEGDIDRITQWTSPRFEGMIALIHPRDSWVARYQEIDSLVRGCYAISCTGITPAEEDDDYE
uniref:Spt4/RpoE2 zinc finger domain-containing protein n=1 Tax=Spongospora subterranea TaxID=70186 RepID=A0A0H5RB09_9EUKA|eukprot:CRZ10991.1 hypothetical protein [Spongospora subterranea]